MTILHVFSAMDRGGAELRTLDVMRRIDRDKYRFVFCTTSGRTGILDDEIRMLGGEVIVCALGRGFAARFRKVIENVNPDVVHSHLHLTSGYILRGVQVPTRIAHLRSMGDGRADTLRRRVQRWTLRRLTRRNATKILSVSEGALDTQWSDWRGDPKFQVIYNGVPFAPFAEAENVETVRDEFTIPSDAPFFIHLGRLDAAKNHERLIAIFGEILRREPRAHLLLVGRSDGPYAAQRVALDALIAKLPSPSQLKWAGERSDVARLLCAADAMIFPSRREGLPGAVTEACLAATPVVSSDVPGACEIAARVAERGLDMVTPLSLSAPDETWAKTALRAASQKFTIGQVHAALKGSAFDLDTCVAQLQQVWDAKDK
ncbi:MAG TPA: glycosyltransferase [Abditibacteriaceae bacterium]|jgi:glycosyltransferase involved in cell wall biosynthesis